MSIASDLANPTNGGNSTTQSKSFQVPEFDKFSTSLNGTIRVSYGNACRLTISAEEDAIEVLDVEVIDGSLNLHPKDTNSASASITRSLASHLLDLILKRPTSHSRSVAYAANYLIEIETPRLRELVFGGKACIVLETDLHDAESMKIVCGGVSAIATNAIAAPTLHLGSSGTASLTVKDVKIDSMNCGISGKAKICASGKAKTFSARISGAASLDAENLLTDQASFVTSGASHATIHAQNELEVSSSGACSVKYLGEPQKNTTFSGVLDCSPLSTKT